MYDWNSTDRSSDSRSEFQKFEFENLGTSSVHSTAGLPFIEPQSQRRISKFPISRFLFCLVRFLSTYSFAREEQSALLQLARSIWL